MNRIIATIIILAGYVSLAEAQLKTYMTIEAGPSWDLVRAEDPGHIFNRSLIYGGTAGVAIWQEVAPNLSLGTGLYYHEYKSGINPDDRRHHQPGLPAYRALLIPARISYRIWLPDLPVSITPRLGYQFGKLPEGPVLREAGSLFSTPDDIVVNWQMTESLPVNRGLNLVEAGFSVDYRFSNNWELSMDISHLSSLSEGKFSEVAYTTSGGANHVATYKSDGSRTEALMSLHIPVSNIWENQDSRLHRKIEHSLGRGGTARSTSYIYFGGDLGALWRAFSTTNPAIGARPVTGRGIFRYSNLAAGGYVGYMPNDATGFDIGLYYHRANTFFTIMVDHENDFILKERAPFILEVPVMFRYYYDLFDRELFLVPALGVSGYTHFSGASYATGSGTFEYNNMSGTATGNFSYDAGRPSRIGVAVRAGLGVEYDIPTPFPLLLTGNIIYSHGFIIFDQVDITTSLPDQPAVNTVGYNGRGWMASVGVRMPFILGRENRKCGALPRIRR